MNFLKLLKAETDSEGYLAVAQCKAVGKIIKTRRMPHVLADEFGSHIPARELADELLEAYLRTFETVHRIVHVPTFRQEYERYWQEPKAANTVFVIQLQLCMALGAVLHDDTFSLRTLAMRWVYEARHWVLQPSEKSRLNLSGLQVWCLIHLARDVSGVASDLIWVSSGSLLRTAIFIGLHRDPDHLPKMSLLAAELRRRLWATILEILVQSSMDAGGPPMISTHDYDTRPPGNFDDEHLQLTDEGGALLGPKPITTFTHTSLQLALLRSIETRLAVARYLNEFRSVATYDKTVALNSELTTASRSLDALLRVYSAQQPGPTPFQLQIAEQLMQRYFLSLHLPWIGLAKHDPRYYFSRKICAETGLRHFKAANRPSEHFTSDGKWLRGCDDSSRLLLCASGMFWQLRTQCIIIVALELLWEFEELRNAALSLGITSSTNNTPGMSISLNGSQLIQDLQMLEALHYAAIWKKTRIRAGAVNVKGYLFACAILAELSGLQNGASDQAIEQAVREASARSAKEALEVLKEMHAAMNTTTGAGGGTAGEVGDGQVMVGGGMAGGDFDGSWDWDEMVGSPLSLFLYSSLSLRAKSKVTFT